MGPRMETGKNSTPALFAALTVAALFLSACEDSVGLESAPKVASVSDLGSCTAENAGEAVFVEDERMLYTCGENGWKAELEPAEYERNCGTDVASNDSVSKCGEDGTFTDSRDGRVYKCVEIGAQVWMAENLDFGEIVRSTANQVKASAAHAQKYCYGDDSTNCAKYGGLYQWHTAMGLCAGYGALDASSQINAPHRGICPAGWHVPTKEEWEELVAFVQSPDSNNAGRMLKSKEGWEKFSEYPRFVRDDPDTLYNCDEPEKCDSSCFLYLVPPTTRDEKGQVIVYGVNGLDEYGWNALPSGHFLHALEYDNMTIHYGPLTSAPTRLGNWKNEFVSDEAFFWSTAQNGDNADGYGMSAYPEHAGSRVNSCDVSTPSKLFADPLYTDPRQYGDPPYTSKQSGSKGSARSVRCVQD